MEIVFFSMPSSQIITIISIFSIIAASIWLMQLPSLFQATVLTGLLRITVLLSSLCHTAGKALCIKYKSVFTPRRKSRFQCLTSKAMPLLCFCRLTMGMASVLGLAHSGLLLDLSDTLNSLWSQGHIPPAPKILLPFVLMALLLDEVLALNAIHFEGCI